MKQNKIKTVTGYFVILGDERIAFKQQTSLDAGRGGIFYKKEDLVKTIQSKTALKKIPMDVVEIAVPTCCITNPNYVKFDIKGGDIKIIKIESFEQAAKEIMMSKVV